MIRSETDTAVVSILDRRVHNERYVSKVEAVIEKYGRVESIEEIEKFISEVKNYEYLSS